MASSRRKKPRAARHSIDQRISFWLDVVIRVMLGVYFAFAAGGYFTRAYAMLRITSGTQSTFEQAVNVFSILALGFFAFFVACLYAVRLKPVTAFAGPVPALTAILGAFLTYGLLFLQPRTDLPVGVKLAADFLIIGGNIFAMLALHHLGRSFSILPEGRELITGGPYRYVRHPLYLAEFFSTFGAMLNFLSPAAVVLIAAQFILQFVRMHYEEKVMRATFPEYAAYSRHTARLVPGIY